VSSRQAQAGLWSAESRVQPGPLALAGSAGFDSYKKTTAKAQPKPAARPTTAKKAKAA